jgi:hypothetical protein
VKKTSEFSEYGSDMNMPRSGDGNNLAFREKYSVVFKRLQRDIDYAIKLNFVVQSKIAQVKETEGSDVIGTSLKEDESRQFTPSPVARSTRIFFPAPVSSPSPVAVTPIATSQRQLDMVDVASTATGPLAKSIYIMSESIRRLSNMDPAN